MRMAHLPAAVSGTQPPASRIALPTTHSPSIATKANALRLARELRDTLAQGLAGLTLQLEAADAQLTRGKAMRAAAVAAADRFACYPPQRRLAPVIGSVKAGLPSAASQNKSPAGPSGPGLMTRTTRPRPSSAHRVSHAVVASWRRTACALTPSACARYNRNSNGHRDTPPRL